MIYACSLPARIPEPFTMVKILEEFDGPLLAEVKDTEGRMWLLSWVDKDKTVNRWLLLPHTPEGTQRYLDGKLSLRDVYLGAAGAHGPWRLLDIAHDGTYAACWHHEGRLPPATCPKKTPFLTPS